jgi:homoserine dehydrogenase
MPPLIVLKLGGSVLAGETALRAAVHEIYRWRRDGHAVVAVVSALRGDTDALLAQSERIAPAADAHAVAALLACGELRSSALLLLHLSRAGIPARVLTPAALALRASGDPLAAHPVAVDRAPLRRALAAGEVAVVPGFVAGDAEGRTVLLGRGGSDLTALFLAAELDADRCRLLKDVDGLYERDPALPGPPPLRLLRASWADALRTDGSIVQHEAVHFARQRGLAFEVGRCQGTRPTRVGAEPSVPTPERDVPRRLRVALLGCGTVGRGVAELVRALPEHFAITGVAVRAASAAHAGADLAPLLTGDAEELAGRRADVVVELLGGTSTAARCIARAIASGAHVVTANKAVLAAHGARLRGLAAAHGVRLLASASVGGSMPLLERVAAEGAGGVRRVRAVLNGTTNFVLGRVAAGSSLEEATAEAVERGFAERDATRDLCGRDAADKLRCVAEHLGCRVAVDVDPPRRMLAALRAARAARQSVPKQVATLRIDGARAHGRVVLELLDPEDPLARVPDEHNAAVLELADGTRATLAGKGAGRWPTSEAVLADLLELAREPREVPAPCPESAVS